MSVVKAIIFDCFGVVLSNTFTNMIADLELTSDQIDGIAKQMDLVNKGTISTEVYRKATAKIAGLTVEEYKRRSTNNTKNEQLLSFVKGLRQDYKIAMLSNVGSLANLESRFDNNELQEYFDVVIASGEIGWAKPEAQAYEITADKLAVRTDECIMIDDIEDYCLGARGVGMQAILYRSFDEMKDKLDQLLK